MRYIKIQKASLYLYLWKALTARFPNKSDSAKIKVTLGVYIANKQKQVASESPERPNPIPKHMLPTINLISMSILSYSSYAPPIHGYLFLITLKANKLNSDALNNKMNIVGSHLPWPIVKKPIILFLLQAPPMTKPAANNVPTKKLRKHSL